MPLIPGAMKPGAIVIVELSVTSEYYYNTHTEGDRYNDD